MFGGRFIFKGYFNRILVHLVPIPHAYVDIFRIFYVHLTDSLWEETYILTVTMTLLIFLDSVRPCSSVFLPAHCFVWSDKLTCSALHCVRLQWMLTCLDVFSLWCVKQILEKCVNVFDSCCCLCSSLWSFPDRGRLWSAMSTHLEAKWPLTAIQPILSLYGATREPAGARTNSNRMLILTNTHGQIC